MSDNKNFIAFNFKIDGKPAVGAPWIMYQGRLDAFPVVPLSARKTVAYPQSTIQSIPTDATVSNAFSCILTWSFFVIAGSFRILFGDVIHFKLDFSGLRGFN
ncbi:hypothetical protein PPTG_22552 [Phytophthora nicotianae INRA-310]|uniref:Uncharacterized protein n=1 Tax=Phytophthora nicotianae (strain INRA-310) TaxID=761204 RepID=W2QG73_PHYN3|nr:hypothetical protein PPTG_22552 [Phytophthora nicotianae INRA-310]ETN11866.1 hypothetical protein PPTG_22552 [Phytophthora nicotianae INRA-310]